MNILICTDASQHSETGADLVTKLNLPDIARIVVLGVSEEDGDQVDLSNSFERIKNLLVSHEKETEFEMKFGNPVEEIVIEANSMKADLVAIGAFGKSHRFLGRIAGSTITRLSRIIPIPLLVARNVSNEFNKILVCTSGEPPALENLSIAAKFLSRIHADIYLLHVMSQIALRLESSSDDLLNNAEAAMMRESLEGLHLKKAIQVLRENGVQSNVYPLLKHGLVVDEVLSEIKKGKFDLLVIGRHFHQSHVQWVDMLLEDITGELIKQASCSVLAI
jgi:nucleotide-binding universal stress UspA family protein